MIQIQWYFQPCILNIVIKKCNHFMYTGYNLTCLEYTSAAQLHLIEHSVSNRTVHIFQELLFHEIHPAQKRHAERCTSRYCQHRTRRHPDPDLHAGGHPRRHETAHTGPDHRDRCPDHPQQHLPPAPAAGRGIGKKGRRTAQVHGLERSDPDRLRRFPGIFTSQQTHHRRWCLFQTRDHR